MKYLISFSPGKFFLLLVSMSAGLLLSACSGNAGSSSTAATPITPTRAELLPVPEDTLDSGGGTPAESAATATHKDNTPEFSGVTSTPYSTIMPEAYPTRKPASAYADLEIITLLPPDAIPAIDNPQFLSVEEADQFYDPEELVMGVSFNGDSRAYSAPFLSNHEIVNDIVGGVKIAVTW